MYATDTYLSNAIKQAIQGIPEASALRVNSTFDPRYGGKVWIGPGSELQLRVVEAVLSDQREELGITDLDIEINEASDLFLTLVVD